MNFYNNAALSGGKRLFGSLAVRAGKKTSRKTAPLRGGTAFFNRAALVGGKKFYNGATLRGGRRFYNGAALTGGWDTTAGFAANSLPFHAYTLICEDIVDKKNINLNLLDEILRRVFLYDNAIATGNRRDIGQYKGEGLQLCAHHLHADLTTSKGKKQAETLWKYIRDKIHYGLKKPPYPYDSERKRVSLKNPLTPWVGTYYSYPAWGENIAADL